MQALFKKYLVLSFCLLVWSSPVLANGNREPFRITVLGDSLSAGYGLEAAEAFPARLEDTLRSSGLDIRVINAGVSGDTTAGGLSRLEWALADDPDLVIVELGGNDALRGLDPDQTAANLDAILKHLMDRDVQPILAGMRAPRNLGVDYYNKFDRIYPQLAARYDIPYYPFFLEGVAGHPELNLADGIHPNPDGVAEIVRRILPLIQRAVPSTDPDRLKVKTP